MDEQGVLNFGSERSRGGGYGGGALGLLRVVYGPVDDKSTICCKV